MSLDKARLNGLLELIGGNFASLIELIESFSHDAEQICTRLKLNWHDSTTIRRDAHTLKANAQSFGALQLASLCQTLEEWATQGKNCDVGYQVKCIESEFLAIRLELQSIVEKGSI